MVARMVWDHEVAGSNPVSPTTSFPTDLAKHTEAHKRICVPCVFYRHIYPWHKSRYRTKLIPHEPYYRPLALITSIPISSNLSINGLIPTASDAICPDTIKFLPWGNSAFNLRKSFQPMWIYTTVSVPYL